MCGRSPRKPTSQMCFHNRFVVLTCRNSSKSGDAFGTRTAEEPLHIMQRTRIDDEPEASGNENAGAVQCNGGSAD